MQQAERPLLQHPNKLVSALKPERKSRTAHGKARGAAPHRGGARRMLLQSEPAPGADAGSAGAAGAAAAAEPPAAPATGLAPAAGTAAAPAAALKGSAATAAAADVSKVSVSKRDQESVDAYVHNATAAAAPAPQAVTLRTIFSLELPQGGSRAVSALPGAWRYCLQHAGQCSRAIAPLGLVSSPQIAPPPPQTAPAAS